MSNQRGKKNVVHAEHTSHSQKHETEQDQGFVLMFHESGYGLNI